VAHPQLHLTATDPKVDLKVNMGDGPATPTAGYAGWEVVDRVRRKGMTSFAGLQPFQQDVPVLLDGYRDNRSVERTLDLLLSLGGGTIFKAFGPIYNPADRYVFGGEPEFGDTIRSEDGTLVRLALTLKLMEYVPADLAGRRKEPKVAVGRGVPVSYTTHAGDTLTKIAHAVYHDWKRWREIGDRNNLSDPHRILPAGKELKL
jgi:nucleoid-associated protein YgaU